MILTVAVSIPLFGQWPSSFFLVGVSIVLLSVFMYSVQGLGFFGRHTKVVVWGLGLAFVAYRWYESSAHRVEETVTIQLPEFHGIRDNEYDEMT